MNYFARQREDLKTDGFLFLKSRLVRGETHLLPRLTCRVEPVVPQQRWQTSAQVAEAGILGSQCEIAGVSSVPIVEPASP